MRNRETKRLLPHCDYLLKSSITSAYASNRKAKYQGEKGIFFCYFTSVHSGQEQRPDREELGAISTGKKKMEWKCNNLKTGILPQFHQVFQVYCTANGQKWEHNSLQPAWLRFHKFYGKKNSKISSPDAIFYLQNLAQSLIFRICNS